MDDLIAQLTDRFNIPADKAQGIVAHVVGFMKDKLPGPVASQLDRFTAGDDRDAGEAAGGGGLMDQAKGALGGLMGKD